MSQFRHGSDDFWQNTMLTIRKITNRSNWNSCRPEILSFIFILCKTLDRILFNLITLIFSKNCTKLVHIFMNFPKIVIACYYEKIISKFCIMEILGLFCIPKTVDVVQSVRTSDCGSEGRGFEPHLPPEKIPGSFYKGPGILYILCKPEATMLQEE